MQEAIAKNETNILQECLTLVEKEARNLQQALLTRDSKLIFEAVERQRIALDSVNEHINLRDPTSIISNHEKKRIIQPMLNRIRRILTLNERMANTLMGVIDKTLSGIALGKRTTEQVYDGYGKIAKHTNPLLINAKG